MSSTQCEGMNVSVLTEQLKQNGDETTMALEALWLGVWERRE